jgi:hypothetical protein
LGIAFKNIKGNNFYPCIQICHKRSPLQINFSVKLPKNFEISQLEEMVSDNEMEDEQIPSTNYINKSMYSKKYNNLINNQKYSDVKIRNEKSNEEMYLNKMMLESNSDYFKEIFEMDEKINEIVVNEDQDLFNIMIDFIYNGKFSFSFDFILDLLKLFHKVSIFIIHLKLKIKKKKIYKGKIIFFFY